MAPGLMPASEAISAMVAAAIPFWENTLVAAAKMLWRRASRWASDTRAMLLVHLGRDTRQELQSTLRGAERTLQAFDAEHLLPGDAVLDGLRCDAEVALARIHDFFQHGSLLNEC